MTWLLIATGFFGGLTAVHWTRQLYHRFATPFSAAVYHSPKGGCTEAIIREIQKARREVLIQAYSFTSEPICRALVEAKGRGVHVEILLDKSNQQQTYTELGHLLEQGMAPHIDALHAIAHNKVMIIDRKVVITGSFNFTRQAELENAENLLVIRGNPDLVRSYLDNFKAHKAHSQAPVLKAPASQRRAA